MLKRVARLSVFVVFILQAAGCNREALKQIQQQHSGDYAVTLFNDSGVLKQHSDHLRLEFRTASSNELVNVNNVHVQASMRMPGMGPMFGNVSSVRQVSPGIYEFDADFSMAGQWNFLVTFEPNGRVQFNLNAQ